MPADPDGEAHGAERWHKATSLWQSPATALAQVEKETGLDRGKWGKLTPSHLAAGTPIASPLPTLTLKEQPHRVGCKDHYTVCTLIPAKPKTPVCSHSFQLYSPAYPSPIQKAPGFIPE